MGQPVSHDVTSLVIASEDFNDGPAQCIQTQISKE